MSPLACCRRSQTAYTNCELFGSAVMLFLSFRKRPPVSAISCLGADHVSPPSVERFTTIPLSPNPPVGGSGSVTRLIACATPFGENVTHGSEARSYGPPFVQRVFCGT